jgi:hypothetical protein
MRSWLSCRRFSRGPVVAGTPLNIVSCAVCSEFLFPPEHLKQKAKPKSQVPY